MDSNKLPEDQQKVWDKLSEPYKKPDNPLAYDFVMHITRAKLNDGQVGLKLVKSRRRTNGDVEEVIYYSETDT